MKLLGAKAGIIIMNARAHEMRDAARRMTASMSTFMQRLAHELQDWRRWAC